MTSSGWWGEAATGSGTVSIRVARRDDGVRLVVEGPGGAADVVVPEALATDLAEALLASTGAGSTDVGGAAGADGADGEGSGPSDPPGAGRPWSEPLPDEATIDRARDEALEVLRQVAADLPEAAEVEVLGVPTFRVATRSFAVVEVADGCPVVRVKVSVAEQERLLADDRYRRDEETGVHGWTSLRVDLSDADSMRTLLISGYRNVAPEHLGSQVTL